MTASDLPTVWANYISIFGFFCLLWLVWRIPKSRVYADAPDQARWRDFRIWATVLIFIQIALYIVFA